MAQVLAMQNRLFQRMMANTENLGAAFAQGATQGQLKLADVQRTRPPTFSSAANPLDADD
ncbi:hypothetical protein E2562_012926 [Oryza meyeriana var. granulata]|uniref:Uncharacterized protein n=1 Tax=Oryza meyeriana var. granulata TaxID=110450 RepID=A0A6G1CH32_9ORYZ|nr:hypothetical protein E2562_012926 [Oryza meyeriana var. granulata]